MMRASAGEAMVEPPRNGDRSAQNDSEQLAKCPFFARHFTAGDIATRAVLKDLVARLSVAGIGCDDLATIELILAEALNNIVEHAYADAPGPVELSVEMQRRGLACQIVDKGCPMPTGEPPNPPLPTIAPPVDIPEGGFGWHIIRCLTTNLTYRRDGVRNTLSMMVPLTDFE